MAGVHSAAQTAGWKLVTSAVHASGGKVRSSGMSAASPTGHPARRCLWRPLAHRARFLLEVVDAAATGGVIGSVCDCRPSMPSMTSPTARRSEASTTSPRALGDLRPAYLHAVETHNLPFDWAAFRRAYKGAYIANGGYDLAKAEAALNRGDADLVSFGLACRLSLIPTS
jgi:2,4-dienoyl-CoA reductase-like NADH-dependent reductase (Old Yellow Enzyme family)